MPRSLLTVDESPLGLTWVIDEWMRRASHALVDEGKVWLIDPVYVDDVVERAAGLGEPVAVLQLLDRHNRDCAAVASRLGIPHLEVPDTVADSPFEAIAVVRVPGWKETALWWPQQRALVVAEVVGANSLYNGGAGGVGMHIMLRPRPPGSLRGIRAEHLLLGHGAPEHGESAAADLEHAYAGARRNLPRALLNLPRVAR